MIDVAMQDGIAVVTMRHGKANALDIEFCDVLAAKFRSLRDDAEAVVLTGQGTIFSAGVDLKRASAGGAGYIREFLSSLHKMFDAVFFQPRPVVAAINGHAIAGGAVLAACADRRIMARGAGRIGVTELQVGVPFPALAFEILRFALPPRSLPEFMLGAATYETEVALARGWVDAAVEPNRLMRDALAAARQMAALSPPAFAQTKAQLRAHAAEKYAAGGQATDKIVTELWCAPEALGRIRAYVARTLNK